MTVTKLWPVLTPDTIYCPISFIRYHNLFTLCVECEVCGLKTLYKYKGTLRVASRMAVRPVISRSAHGERGGFVCFAEIIWLCTCKKLVGCTVVQQLWNRVDEIRYALHCNIFLHLNLL